MHEYADNVTRQSLHFVEDQTYNRGGRVLQTALTTTKNAKNTVLNKFDDVYYGVKKFFHRKVDNVKESVGEAVETTTDSAKQYCEAGLQKVNNLIEEFKREKEKYLGSGHALKPAQERGLEAVSRNHS